MNEQIICQDSDGELCELPLEAIVKHVTGLSHSCFNLCFSYMEVCNLNPGGDLQSTSIPAGSQPGSQAAMWEGSAGGMRWNPKQCPNSPLCRSHTLPR